MGGIVNPQNEKRELANEQVKEFNLGYQKFFFDFFCRIIKDYEEYLNMDYFKSSENDVVTSIETLFNCEKFIKSKHESDQEFYQKFVNESQIFVDFIYKRMMPRNNQEMIDILYVNDSLFNKKKSNMFLLKKHNDFFERTEYKISNKYLVQKPRELSDQEKQEIKLKAKDLYKKGQILRFNTFANNENDKRINSNTIVKKKTSIDEVKVENTKKESSGENNKEEKSNNTDNNNNNKNVINNKNSKVIRRKSSNITNYSPIVFNYGIFPELDFSIYCNNDNINEFFLPPDYSEEIETINIDVISKSSIGQNINRALEMKNYLYLTCLQIWAYSFWYIC